VDGTGTPNYLTKWTDADTIEDSIISDNGAIATVSGALVVTGTIDTPIISAVSLATDANGVIIEGTTGFGVSGTAGTIPVFEAGGDGVGDSLVAQVSTSVPSTPGAITNTNTSILFTNSSGAGDLPAGRAGWITSSFSNYASGFDYSSAAAGFGASVVGFSIEFADATAAIAFLGVASLANAGAFAAFATTVTVTQNDNATAQFAATHYARQAAVSGGVIIHFTQALNSTTTAITPISGSGTQANVSSTNTIGGATVPAVPGDEIVTVTGDLTVTGATTLSGVADGVALNTNVIIDPATGLLSAAAAAGGPTSGTNTTVAGTAVNLDASLTGITSIAGAAATSLNISSTGTDVDAIHLNATAGDIDIDAFGVLTIDADEIVITSASKAVDILSTASDVIITSTSDDINMTASSGTVDINADTFDLDAAAVQINATNSMGGLVIASAGTATISGAGAASISGASSTSIGSSVSNTTLTGLEVQLAALAGVIVPGTDAAPATLGVGADGRLQTVNVPSGVSGTAGTIPVFDATTDGVGDSVITTTSVGLIGTSVVATTTPAFDSSNLNGGGTATFEAFADFSSITAPVGGKVRIDNSGSVGPVFDAIVTSAPTTSSPYTIGLQGIPGTTYSGTIGNYFSAVVQGLSTASVNIANPLTVSDDVTIGAATSTTTINVTNILSWALSDSINGQTITGSTNTIYYFDFNNAPSELTDGQEYTNLVHDGNPVSGTWTYINPANALNVGGYAHIMYAESATEPTVGSTTWGGSTFPVSLTADSEGAGSNLTVTGATTLSGVADGVASNTNVVIDPATGVLSVAAAASGGYTTEFIGASTTVSAVKDYLYILANPSTVTITLPASPADGDTIGIANNFVASGGNITNQLVAPGTGGNTDKIMGDTSNLVIDNGSAAFDLVFSSAGAPNGNGWTIVGGN
jgi:hypothetical protein